MDKVSGADGWFHKQELVDNEIKFIIMINDLFVSQENASEEKREGTDKVNIKAGGDVFFDNDRAVIIQNRNINNATFLQESIETKLKDLTLAVEEITRHIPQEKKEELKNNLEVFSSEVVKEQPRKPMV